MRYWDKLKVHAGKGPEWLNDVHPMREEMARDVELIDEVDSAEHEIMASVFAECTDTSDEMQQANLQVLWEQPLVHELIQLAFLYGMTAQKEATNENESV